MSVRTHSQSEERSYSRLVLCLNVCAPVMTRISRRIARTGSISGHVGQFSQFAMLRLRVPFVSSCLPWMH